MLYNWDDMHIIRFSLRRNALPSKPIAVGFLLESYFSEAKLMSKRCRPWHLTHKAASRRPSFIIRTIHILPDCSRASDAKHTLLEHCFLSVHQLKTPVLEASMQMTFDTYAILHKNCSDCIYNIYIYINKYIRSWKEGKLKSRVEKQNKTWSWYALIMQFLGYMGERG